MTNNKRVVDISKTWVGTPYRYQCRLKGQGVDCLGLIVGIWEELYKTTLPEKLPPYNPAWLGHYKKEDLIENLSRYLKEISKEKIKAGDVLVFRISPSQPAKHCAILLENDKMIHAYTGHGVVEGYYDIRWKGKFAKAFRFNKKKV